VEETWSFVLDGVAKSVTCTLLDDDDARQCDNTGTLPSLFSFSSLGARRHCRASRDAPEFLSFGLSSVTCRTEHKIQF